MDTSKNTGNGFMLICIFYSVAKHPAEFTFLTVSKEYVEPYEKSHVKDVPISTSEKSTRKTC